MIHEHDVVVLTRALPDLSLQIGDVGTVVHVYADSSGFEVEFLDGGGRTIGVCTLDAESVRERHADEIFSVRSLKSA
ncbi:DUF4926 domain-containing protein [Lacunimicrobium album]